MVVYLLADFYRLRDELNDWHDTPCTNPGKSQATERVFDAESCNDCTDPSWRIF